MRGKCTLGLGRCADRVACLREDEEERVPLGVDLTPAGGPAYLAQKPLVVFERLLVPISPEAAAADASSFRRP
jgi:hypothetical protein